MKGVEYKDKKEQEEERTIGKEYKELKKKRERGNTTIKKYTHRNHMYRVHSYTT